MANRTSVLPACVVLVVALLACKQGQDESEPDPTNTAPPQTVMPQAAEPGPAATPAPAATGALTFTLDRSGIDLGQSVLINFSQAIPATPGGRHWITIVPLGSADSTWGDWKWVDAGTTFIQLKPRRAGTFEVRLHSPHPQNAFGVLHRLGLSVAGRTAQATPAPAPRPASAAVTIKCAPHGATTICDCPGGGHGATQCNEKVGWSKCSCPKAKAACSCSRGKVYGPEPDPNVANGGCAKYGCAANYRCNRSNGNCECQC